MVTCKVGQIRRRGYTRADGTYVKAVCVKDTGLPGKTPARRRVLPKPIKGALGQYGYTNIKRTPATVRRQALTKAVKDAGYATIMQRVNLVATYNKNSQPEVHRRMKSDITWMRRHLGPVYSAAAEKTRNRSRSRSRKPAVAAIKQPKGTRSRSVTSRKQAIPAGSKVVAGKVRKLYKTPGSKTKFYRYKGTDGKLKKRYVTGRSEPR